MWYDNGAIHVFLGVTGWCYTVNTVGGRKAGGCGYGSQSAALAAARSKVSQ